MKTMSDRATRLQPSPTAGPFTAATIGTRQPTMPVTICRPWASVSLRSGRHRGQLVEVGEVPAGREGPPVAGEHHGPGLGVGVDLREELGQPAVQLVVGGVQVLGPVQADDAHRPVGLDLQLGGHVGSGHEAGSPRMRPATRLRWICDVPPMTLWARL